MKLFVAGSLNMDLVIRAPRIPEQGMTLTGDGFFMNPGGKGANQAVAAAKLGADAYMVGAVGNAFGEELLAALRGYGVDTRFVARREDVPSGIAVIVVVGGDNRIILDRGANACADGALIARALEGAGAGDLLLVQLETGVEFAAEALRRAKARGMTTLLNPAPALPLPAGVLPLCDYFLPNQTEAQFYTGIYPADEVSCRRCAEALFGQGAKRVLVTLGEAGSVYFSEEESYRSAAYPVTAVDTTAAGDTYVAAFAVRRAEGASVPEAMAFASKASALTVTRRGAQQSIPLRAEVDAL